MVGYDWCCSHRRRADPLRRPRSHGSETDSVCRRGRDGVRRAGCDGRSDARPAHTARHRPRSGTATVVVDSLLRRRAATDDGVARHDSGGGRGAGCRRGRSERDMARAGADRSGCGPARSCDRLVGTGRPPVCRGTAEHCGRPGGCRFGSTRSGLAGRSNHRCVRARCRSAVAGERARPSRSLRRGACPAGRSRSSHRRRSRCAAVSSRRLPALAAGG